MEVEVKWMNARVRSEGINVGKQAVEEVIANTGLLEIVEASAVSEILNRGPEQTQLHSKR